MSDARFRKIERAAANGDPEAMVALEQERMRNRFALPGFEHFMDSRILLLGARWHYEGILRRCEGSHLMLEECRQIFNYTKENGVSAADDLPGVTACNADHVSATCISFFNDRPKVRGNCPPATYSDQPTSGYAHLMHKRVLLLGARWHYDGDLVGCAGDQLLLRNARMIFNYTLEDGISASDMLNLEPGQEEIANQTDPIRGTPSGDVQGLVAANWKHVASASESPFEFAVAE